MKIITLIENGKLDMPQLKSEHGVCLYVETGTHKLLLDVGNTDMFLHNAKALGVDISQVDSLVISHGHMDHGGGLKYFLENNSRAKVYLKASAFEGHFASLLGLKLSCGLDINMLDKHRERFVLLDKDFSIADGITIVADIRGNHELPRANQNLYMLKDGRKVPDDFRHELLLLAREGDNLAVLSGCGHSGILNIVDTLKPYLKAEEKLRIISGFHLRNPLGGKKSINSHELGHIAEYLLAVQNLERVYTGHCTGEEAYLKLKEMMGDKLERFTTGKVISI